MIDGDPPQPDPIEKRLRFGCGMLFGIFLLGVGLLRFVTEPTLPLWYYWATGLGALLIGLVAMRMGDALYHKLAAFFRWW